MKDLNELTRTLNTVYGVGLTWASPTTVLWAAERCANPRAALKAANRRLAKYGRPLAYAPYGSPAF